MSVTSIGDVRYGGGIKRAEATVFAGLRVQANRVTLFAGQTILEGKMTTTVSCRRVKVLSELQRGFRYLKRQTAELT